MNLASLLSGLQKLYHSVYNNNIYIFTYLQFAWMIAIAGIPQPSRFAAGVVVHNTGELPSRSNLQGRSDVDVKITVGTLF